MHVIWFSATIGKQTGFVKTLVTHDFVCGCFSFNSLSVKLSYRYIVLACFGTSDKHQKYAPLFSRNNCLWVRNQFMSTMCKFNKQSFGFGNTFDRNIALNSGFTSMIQTELICFGFGFGFVFRVDTRFHSLCHNRIRKTISTISRKSEIPLLQIVFSISIENFTTWKMGINFTFFSQLFFQFSVLFLSDAKFSNELSNYLMQIHLLETIEQKW